MHAPVWKLETVFFPTMALFPAFSGLSSNKAPDSKSSSEGLDWLSNQSFRTEDALTLHRLVVEEADESTRSPTDPRFSVENELSDGREDEDVSQSRKKKKKKKEKKKQKKRSSEGDAGLIFPSDLLRSEQEADGKRQEKQLLPEGTFRWADEFQAPPELPFCVDKKADPANWEYKSLYRADIARYKRKGNCPLGLNPKTQGVTWDDSASEKKKGEKRQAQERYFSRAGRQLLSAEGAPVRPRAEPPSPRGGFLPLPDCPEEGASAAAAPSWLNPLGIYDSSTALWLQGKGQPEGEAPPPGALCAAGPAARAEEYNRRLRENPADVQTWMEFVRFQDELMAGPSAFSMTESDSDKGKRSLRVTVEKKVSILERAIESSPGSVELKLARLELCQELWEPSTLLKEWKKLIFLHPNNTELWRKYLVFSQSQFSTFSVLKVNGVYGKCLSTLAAVHDGSMVSHPALPGTEEAILEMFLQQCQFLRQAGHSEKALSLFQALLDFTFFKPDSVKDLPTRQQVEFFEPFWDSGEPRIGERGARGWKAWMRQQERGGWIIPTEADDDDEDADDDDGEVKDRSLPKPQVWLEVEASREARHWLPWRPDRAKGQSEEDCEDPDRQVLFDDIGPSMIRISKPELRFQLVCSFLHFLGIPAECSSSDPFWSIFLDNLSVLEEGLEWERPLTSLYPEHAGISSVGHMTTLRSAKKPIGLCKQGEEFVQNVFQQLLPLCSSEEKSLLTLYWIQYEKLKVLRCLQSNQKKRLKSQGKKSKRLAKSLLKVPENRNCLGLWRQYAHLEWLLGNLEDARKVFDTAIAMGTGRGLQDAALCELCLLYAQLEVEAAEGAAAGASSRAAYILTKLAEGGPYSEYEGQVSPVGVLKARKAYEHAFLDVSSRTADGPVQPGTLGRAVSVAGCFALFQYLTMGIEAADKVYRQAGERVAEGLSTKTSARPSELETLALMQATLLRYHMKVSVFPVRPLREALTAALRRSQGSARLWKLYVQLESRYHSASRARRFFHSVTRSTGSVVPWLFAIHAEQQRKELVDSVQRVGGEEMHSTIPENGLSNRIRVLFEKAIASENGSHCPLLWRMYLHFLVSQGNTERSRGIFYKALQNVPWAKGLYMDAVAYFPERVQEFLDLMTEKELRLRVPMEELDILLED
uniref:NRDE-2, necessary for RNA interference, domain containing n=1 Tax=Lepisosteus oculatus TaxID=7918 RepID=W5MRL3_LEPOC|nr:PREDICTED: protein NRDE2 homolog [Lepisosteus oculatus]